MTYMVLSVGTTENSLTVGASSLRMAVFVSYFRTFADMIMLATSGISSESTTAPVMMKTSFWVEKTA